MAKYDLTNVTPFNEQPLYKQGFKDAIDAACEWLYEHAKAYGEADGLDAVYLYDKEMLVRHFRKAMEEEI